MTYTWPKESMLNLFLDSEVNGVTSVELKSNYEAELFRFALYNFRRRSKNYSKRFKPFQIIVEKTKLTISKSIEVEIIQRTGT